MENGSHRPVKQILAQGELGVRIPEKQMAAVLEVPERPFSCLGTYPVLHAFKGDCFVFAIVPVKLIKKDFCLQEVVHQVPEKQILSFFNPAVHHEGVS